MYTYIHIPFCKSKCTYCDFFSVEKQTVSDRYVDALLKEAEFRVNYHSVTSWKSLYFGGGTPGLLSSSQVGKIFSGLLDLCPIEETAEVTFEVNPVEIAGDSGEDYLHSISACGVNRISCGIQALDNEVLSFVKRRSNSEECLKALKVLSKWRDFCKNNTKRESQFSVDLIAGLPALSDSIFVESLNTVLSYNPNHISLYSLILEENTPLFKQIAKNYDDDKADLQWILGRDILFNNGFKQYEVSNFSKTACCESEHNKAYWRMDDYLGLGCTACGTIGNTRYTGTKNIDLYCRYWATTNNKENTPSFICETEQIDKEARMFEYLMMGFRTLKGVNENTFYNRFEITLESKIGKVFSKWEQKGYAKKTGEYFSLTPDGIIYLNSFLSEII